MFMVITALPVYHVILCYVCAFFYTGFGAGIYEFSKASDIFVLSITKIVPGYLLILLGSAIGFLWQVRDPLKVIERKSFEIHPFLRTKASDAIYFSIYAALFFLFLYAIFSLNFVSGFLLVFFIALPLGFITNKILVKNKIDQRFKIIIFGMVFVTLIAFSNSFRAGFSLRHDENIQFSDYPRCKEGIILFSVGDNLVVVKQNNQRVLVDGRCEQIAIFPRREVLLWYR